MHLTASVSCLKCAVYTWTGVPLVSMCWMASRSSLNERSFKVYQTPPLTSLVSASVGIISPPESLPVPLGLSSYPWMHKAPFRSLGFADAVPSVYKAFRSGSLRMSFFASHAFSCNTQSSLERPSLVTKSQNFPASALLTFGARSFCAVDHCPGSCRIYTSIPDLYPLYP